MMTIREFQTRMCRYVFWASVLPGLIYLIVFLAGPRDAIATFVFFALYFAAFVFISKKFMDARTELNEVLEFRKVHAVMAAPESDSPAPVSV